MYDLHRRVLSQNFLRSRKLVNGLVGLSSIGKDDLVLDIGAGKGIITESLLQAANNVIAIELDNKWVEHLRQKFIAESSVQVVHADVLSYQLPDTPYKVFANIPFSIEGKIIRKLLNYTNPPEDMCLVIRKDLAERLMGNGRECLFSVTYKPWFAFEIIYTFSKFDYEPAARMETVLLRITKKVNPDIPFARRDSYTSFVKKGFGKGGKLSRNLDGFIPGDLMKSAFQKCSISYKSKPAHLNIGQWIRLFSQL